MNELSDIVAELGDISTHGSINGVRISGMTHDTRNLSDGCLFFCVRGAHRDGHDHAVDAERAGAAAIVCEHVVDGVSVPQLVVSDVRAVMGPMADLFHDRPSRDVAVFGVTGTNGKTTTSFLLRAMLGAAHRSVGLVGTTGVIVGGVERETNFTTPEATELQSLFADMRDAGDDACAIEVSSHALDMRRTSATRFAAVGFTNLTRDHLDYHRSFEAYFHAKRRLFVEPGPEGQFFPAAINCDDEWGSRLFDELVHGDHADVPVWGYTLHEMTRASVSARYHLTAEGASIHVESPAGDFTLTSQLRGRFNVENVLCATTMALLVGITPAQIQAGLDTVAGIRGRFEPVDEGQPFTVLVDYAHTPDSLEQVVASARAMCDGDLIVVFGCGGDRDRSKRPLMGRVVARGADVAIVTSDNPRSEDPDAIIAEIRKGMRSGAEVHVEPDRRTAIFDAVSRAGKGDVVLIAGKGHEQGQTFADEVVPFDDATVAREALAAVAVS